MKCVPGCKYKTSSLTHKGSKARKLNYNPEVAAIRSESYPFTWTRPNQPECLYETPKERRNP